MNIRNEIKAQIVRAGFTMQEIVDRLAEEYDWSDSVSNLSAKLQRESIRYKEVMELADVLDCDIVWMKRGARRSSERHALHRPVHAGAVRRRARRRRPRQLRQCGNKGGIHHRDGA